MKWLRTFVPVRKELEKRIKKCSSNEEHPLIAVASTGNIEIVKYLIDLHPKLLDTQLYFEHGEETRNDCTPFVVISRMAAQKAGSDPDLAEKMAQIVQYIAELDSFSSEYEYCSIIVFKLLNELIDNYDPIKFTLAKYFLQKFPKLANASASYDLPLIHYSLNLEKYDLVEFFFTIPGFDKKFLDKTDENGRNLLDLAFSKRQLVLSQLLLQHAPHLLVSLGSKAKSPLSSFFVEREKLSDEDEQFLSKLLALPEFQSAVRTVRCPTTGDTILHQLVAQAGWIRSAKWVTMILKISPELRIIKNKNDQLLYHVIFDEGLPPPLPECGLAEIIADIVPSLFVST